MQGPSGQDQTTIVLADHKLVVTLAMAKQIQRALQAYLTGSREEMANNLPAPLLENLPQDVGEAFIDSSGQVRMGLWQLEARGNELVSTYREAPPTPGINIQYIAHLERAKTAGQWKVASVTYTKIYPRR